MELRRLSDTRGRGRELNEEGNDEGAAVREDARDPESDNRRE